MLRELNAADLESLTAWLKSRTQTISGDIYKAAADIIDQVRQTGDQALRDLALKFDHRSIRTLKLTQEQIDELASQADPAFVQALQGARDNILAFHQAQKTNSFILTRDNGVYLGQRVLPLDAVGIYVPGGRAQYPSSVLMNAIPARVAGVKRIVMMTPPAENGLIEPAIACAAKLAGVTEIYVTGGAQAIAAMAYGTETIAPVDKIVGPGNAFVAAAKKLVFGTVDIDMIAGPSEILVIADAGADPAWIAADLLSQAEHDPLASAMLVTTEQTVIDQVNRELVRQLETLPKKDIAAASLADYGRSILCSSMEKCLQVANRIAPEHLELMVENPMNWLGQVRHAGSVFLGYSTCESIGDYYGGTNHVLPTSGTAKFSSALGVDAFVKRSSFLHYSPEQLEQDAEAIMTLAQAEHLQAHANAAAIRVAADRQKGGQ
ncbi:histidinol dehydrogenase [uncultured Faecalibaculum sp.]|uniref:histidinol dehydrogenase n=1 Tax=uncultured Faecalibaculum sp. TaxID=1729681 RepID=UPI0025E386B6|nr:histidinol dehydrogenase [uncultured Faecalibaculum sp.]